MLSIMIHNYWHFCWHQPREKVMRKASHPRQSPYNNIPSEIPQVKSGRERLFLKDIRLKSNKSK